MLSFEENRNKHINSQTDINKGNKPLESEPLSEGRINRERRSVILILDPNPAADQFYEGFFPGNKLIKSSSHKECTKLAAKAMKDGTLSAIVIDDRLEDEIVPLLVSLFKTLLKKMSSDVNVFVTYRDKINMKKYFVKPDVVINKTNGSIDVFY